MQYGDFDKMVLMQACPSHTALLSDVSVCLSVLLSFSGELAGSPAVVDLSVLDSVLLLTTLLLCFCFGAAHQLHARHTCDLTF